MSDLEWKLKLLTSRSLMEQQLKRVRQPSEGSDRELRRASEEFEALFVQFLLRSMRKTVMKSGLLDTGLQGDILQALFDQELSRQVARSARLGIAEMVQQQLKPTLSPQGDASNPVHPWQQTPRRLPGNVLEKPAVHRLKPFEAFIEKAARIHKLNANLIRSVILAESSGDPKAVSPKGAKGLMQLMDGTAKALGVRDVFNPEENVLAGSAYLAQLLARFGGELSLALAAYNAGPSAVEKYGGIPPFSETRLYVRKIFNYLKYLEGR